MPQPQAGSSLTANLYNILSSLRDSEKAEKREEKTKEREEKTRASVPSALSPGAKLDAKDKEPKETLAGTTPIISTRLRRARSVPKDGEVLQAAKEKAAKEKADKAAEKEERERERERDKNEKRQDRVSIERRPAFKELSGSQGKDRSESKDRDKDSSRDENLSEKSPGLTREKSRDREREEREKGLAAPQPSVPQSVRHATPTPLKALPAALLRESPESEKGVLKKEGSDKKSLATPLLRLATLTGSDSGYH
jgi:hypothetical protein